MLRCYPYQSTLHWSDRRDFGFWSSCHFQSFHWDLNSDRNPIKIRINNIDHLTFVTYEFPTQRASNAKINSLITFSQRCTYRISSFTAISGSTIHHQVLLFFFFFWGGGGGVLMGVEWGVDGWGVVGGVGDSTPIESAYNECELIWQL